MWIMRNGSCINQNESRRQTRDKQKIAGEVHSPVSVYDFQMIPITKFLKQRWAVPLCENY